MKLFTCLILLGGFVLFTGCSKKDITPDTAIPEAAVIGNWKLVRADGVIDSSIIVNPVKTTTKLTLSFDSVSNQYTHLRNGQVVYQYPYSLIITFNKNGSDQLIENYTRPNTAGISTPYCFVTNSFWNYTTSIRVDDGLVIKGFEKTSALGYYKINPSIARGANTIQSILTVPYFTSYDYKSGHLFLYVHLQFIGNADNQGGGVITNPGTQINMNYTLMFSRTGGVTDYD